jgi:hypothetical protein
MLLREGFSVVDVYEHYDTNYVVVEETSFEVLSDYIGMVFTNGY